MAVAVRRMSAEEYLAGPETSPGTTELIDGMIAVTEPLLPHLRAQQHVHFALMTWVREAQGRGMAGMPADVRIDEANVFAPDVWWVPEHRRPSPDALRLDGVPDLVVEVRSPSTWSRDLAVKLPRYEAAGVTEAWFVDVRACAVLVFRRSNPAVPTFDVQAELVPEDDLTSPMLPGFSLRVSVVVGPSG